MTGYGYFRGVRCDDYEAQKRMWEQDKEADRWLAEYRKRKATKWLVNVYMNVVIKPMESRNDHN
jgi:hypothetical protein